MLDLDALDLELLCHALEDHSHDARWWLDPRTGELQELEEEGEELDARGLTRVEPLASDESYGDLVDFTARVRDPRAGELLERAIAGRGAFRRFKDTLFEFPTLREAWFAFHDARMQRRAIRWLLNEGLIDPQAAEAAIAARPDPESLELAGRLDPQAVAEAVAADLKELYGERLRHVILFGSWARGDAHPESDIDLLVVLDQFESRWEERQRMSDIIAGHSFDNGTLVSALPIDERSFEAAELPVVANARDEGRPIV